MRRRKANAFESPNFIDRKSTRLNSSHLAISYAVFCLKEQKLLRDLLPEGPQLATPYQPRHRQALCPPCGRGRVRARVDGRAPRSNAPPPAPDLPVPLL